MRCNVCALAAFSFVWPVVVACSEKPAAGTQAAAPAAATDPAPQKEAATSDTVTDAAVKTDGKNPCGGEVASETPDAQSGRIVVQLDATVDPCSVKGYVVGAEGTLEIKMSAAGELAIDNAPAGKHDVVVTGTVALATSLTEETRGIRLNGVAVKAGQDTRTDKLTLPAVGTLKGRVRLAGETDHSGIDVYIPGTGFAAKTDSQGAYSISPYVVAGTTNLYFERDGYHRGQIEGIEVVGGQVNVAEDLTLILSLGATGGIQLAGGEAVVKSRTVPYVVGSTPNAKLMKVAETNTFDGVEWRPVVTTGKHLFATEGAKTLYVQFADANGLASSPFGDDVLVDLFADDEGEVEIAGGAATSSSRTVALALDVPENAEQMQVSALADFAGASWRAATAAMNFTFPGQGPQTVFVRYRDADGFTSATFSDSVDVQLFPAGPNPIVVNAGATTASSRTLSVALTIPGNAAEMRLSHRPDFLGASWQDVATPVSFQVPGVGAADVYVQFRDADDFESAVHSDGIVVDLFGDVTVSFGLASATVQSPARTFTLNAITQPANGASIEAATDAGFTANVASFPPATSVSYQLPANNAFCGTSTIHLRWKDVDGFTSPTATQSATISCWTTITTTNAPTARMEHVAALAGSQFVVFSGGDNSYNTAPIAGGSSFDGSAWTALPAPAMPAAREYHSGLWTGSELIVWGGSSTSTEYNSGGRYNLTSWTATDTSDPDTPSARRSHSAVWTGTEMIVWGGNSDYNYPDGGMLATGGRYNPTTNTWATVSTVNAPTARMDHTAVWTGTEMIVWGGYSTFSSQPNTGARYNPATDTWTAMTTTNAPLGRAFHTAIWTGSRMIVWGGWNQGASPRYLGDGKAYDPATDTWTNVSATGAPTARGNHGAVWLSSKMVVWGGQYGAVTPTTRRGDGGIYDPATDTWTPVGTSGAPEARTYHRVDDNGSAMYVWGGEGASGYLNTGAIFTPLVP